jgi:N-glycosylase/DNA lyase
MKAPRELQIDCPPNFALRSVAFSHGWFDLPPFEWDDATQCLRSAFACAGGPTSVGISQPTKRRLLVRVGGSATNAEVRTAVCTMLGVDRSLAGFYRAAGEPFAWAKKRCLGRFLRGASLFEDAVKMLATTNCSWGLTKIMVGHLVEALGEPTADGKRAFPTPQAMAERNEAFYRERIKAGYRARYFREFARRVADGRVDLTAWENFPGPASELAKLMRQELGFGPYVVENLGRLLGRFDGLGLDSWCRAKFVKLFGKPRGDLDKAIAKKYAGFGEWRGLALWLDLTRDWHGAGKFVAGKFVLAK